MYVKNKMITDVITVFPEASISLAFQTMHEKGVKQLPVVKNGKLVGLVTETLLAEFSPSKATSLSIYELNYILAKTKVASIMATDVPVCHPDMLIETVVSIMREQDVNMLPVVNENNTLVGVISRNDMLDAFLEIIGAKDTGARIAIEAPNRTGTLADIATIITEYGANITHITIFTSPDGTESELILRMNTGQVDGIIQALEKKGYRVLRVDQSAGA
ncbi:CBS and ACT domain-containing protein [Anaerotalea alkaliphila]|uniref:CBS domain-containing protein n=1 Tax=Anaerotalea alkaliphila TaxID=2662126 RepID=A0A7X5KMZ5_9FIRM|nr:CBS and ACT domain-containing protein [Anaerotalea alkaliphila]NDL66272.1 CBS domain-containing protein [Anaerotalea alkaliphila]